MLKASKHCFQILFESVSVQNLWKLDILFQKLVETSIAMHQQIWIHQLSDL